MKSWRFQKLYIINNVESFPKLKRIKFLQHLQVDNIEIETIWSINNLKWTEVQKYKILTNYENVLKKLKINYF